MVGHSGVEIPHNLLGENLSTASAVADQNNGGNVNVRLEIDKARDFLLHNLMAENEAVELIQKLSLFHAHHHALCEKPQRHHACGSPESHPAPAFRLSQCWLAGLSDSASDWQNAWQRL